jgi:hypothetical protein
MKVRSVRLHAISVWVVGATAVTTIRPRLPASSIAGPTKSPCATDGVNTTAAAIAPRVISVTRGNASAASTALWVAPNSLAASRFHATGSTATI